MAASSSLLLNKGISPPQGWVKVNVDGAASVAQGRAGAGGEMRSHNSQWQGGFVANIGSGPAIVAELWAILYGLELAWKHGQRTVLVETDSLLAIQLIESMNDLVYPHATILGKIRRTIANDWLVDLVHVYREGNRVADSLSKHILVYPCGMHALDQPSSKVRALIQDDLREL